MSEYTLHNFGWGKKKTRLYNDACNKINSFVAAYLSVKNIMGRLSVRQRCIQIVIVCM